MLIIALGVLTLMAILGAAFATLVRLEKKATDNYVDGKRMDYLMDSAVDRAIADLQAAPNFRHYTFYDPKGKSSPWLNLIRTRTGQLEGDLANGRLDIDDPSGRVGTWEVFTERSGQTHRFRTKIIDCASQINLNGKQDTLARMIDNLGKAIESSDRLKRDGKKIRNPLYERPNGGGNLIKGSQIIQLRNRLPGGVFGSKSELKLVIGPENFDNIKDFVTVHSWEDPDTYKATDGLNEVADITGAGTTTTGGGSKGIGGSGGQRQPAAYGVPRLDAEPRHPININTAPEEVLIACLQGLAGRRVFPYSKLGVGGSMGDLDQGSQVTGDRIAAGKEEIRDVTPRAVFAYTAPLLYEHAKKLADRIVQERKQKPFMAWRTNDLGQRGFEDFIDRLEPSFFPSPTSCQIVDPDKPQVRDAESAIKNNPASEMGRMWAKGHGAGAIRSTRQNLGLSYHEQFAWYYDLVKGVIKSNANPNSRINRYNPNVPAYIPVDKSDLVWLQTGRVNLYKGHTTEFCFDTGGTYEVTTYGQIAERDKSGEPTTFAPGQRGLEAIRKITLERKMRTVVKVHETLRHTNQFQFARTFNVGARSSANNRKYVVTWPDPLAALTEVWSTGSLRDGRIELAGLLDGRRLEMPIFQRTTSLRKNQNLLMAHTFQDRDSSSIANLVRIVSQGIQSRQGDVVSQALGEVYDAGYSKQKETNRRHVRRLELVQLGGGSISQEAIPSDPLIDREVLGTDLYPDGINTSILRMSHLQTRSLVLPARVKIGDTAAGEGSPLVGASGRSTRGTNVLGNVPYYRGGIAFFCKFEFDGDDPVFSGLIGCTQVIKEVSPNASDFTGSEGTQFFIFKNSVGQLRVVRMYYHQAFLNEQGSAGGSGSSGGGEGIKLYPDPGAAAAGGAAGGNTQNPIIQELDPKKVISRSDILVDIKHFKAHEWHHIGIEWDDENQNMPRLYLDFTAVEVPTYHAQDPSTLAPPPSSWVRLNERQPRDGLFVGSIIRDQGLSDGGIFKWFTNSTATAGGGGVQTIATQTKRILANATIDELITFENNFLGAKQYYGAQGSPGYFTNQPGEYANLFEIPVPPDIDSVMLRSLDWTSYYPTTYADSKPGSIPVKLTLPPQLITCEVYYPSGSSAVPPAFTEPWRRPQVANDVAGRVAYRQSAALKGSSIPLVYTFRMQGVKAQGGNAGGGVVQTPVIDDVTLTYFLPNPRILIQEEAD